MSPPSIPSNTFTNRSITHCVPGKGLCWSHRGTECIPIWVGGFARSKLDVGCWMFGVHHKCSEYNYPPTPLLGWSGGTLDKPRTCPGTIEPPQTPVFDQPNLSKPLSQGTSAAQRF